MAQGLFYCLNDCQGDIDNLGWCNVPLQRPNALRNKGNQVSPIPHDHNGDGYNHAPYDPGCSV